MTRETSIEAYKLAEDSGLLNRLRLQVSCVIAVNGPITQGEAWKEHFPHKQRHSVAPRFAELAKMGVIKIVGERACRVTGINSVVWDMTGNRPLPLLKSETNKQKIARLEKENEDLKAQVARLRSVEVAA